MKQNILEKFEHLLERLDQPTFPKLENLVQECLQFFEELKQVLQTGTEEEKKEILKMTQELQQKLEEHGEKAHKASGYTREQIEEVLEDPKTFSEEEKQSYEKIKNDLASYRGDFLKRQVSESAKELSSVKKKKAKKEKFRG
jgi:hypothetical protein